MAKPEWGVKRICQSCGLRFYDLRRSPIVCPACKAVFSPDQPVRLKRGAPLPQAIPAAPAPVEPIADAVGEAGLSEEVEEEAADDEEAPEPEVEKPAKKDEKEKADEIIEDASDLGEDEDDVSEVKEHIDEGKNDRL